MDLEDFCAIMERHQPEDLVVTTENGSDGGRHNDERGDEESNSPVHCGVDAQGGRNDAHRRGGGGSNGTGGGHGGGESVVSREEVISNLVELFKEVQAGMFGESHNHHPTKYNQCRHCQECGGSWYYADDRLLLSNMRPICDRRDTMVYCYAACPFDH